jgi:hypothetical protein
VAPANDPLVQVHLSTLRASEAAVIAGMHCEGELAEYEKAPPAPAQGAGLQRSEKALWFLGGGVTVVIVETALLLIALKAKHLLD